MFGVKCDRKNNRAKFKIIDFITLRMYSVSRMNEVRKIPRASTAVVLLGETPLATLPPLHKEDLRFKISPH